MAGEPGQILLYVDARATTARRIARYAELSVTWLASDVISARRWSNLIDGAPRSTMERLATWTVEADTVLAF